ncbi:hypothetical protein BH23BAC2_BH23BAC2_23170 [soil metagenome]
MVRHLNVENFEEFNPWIAKSLMLAKETPYLDEILEVYPFMAATPRRLRPTLRNGIIRAHSTRNTRELIKLLRSINKFPYEDPIWFMLKNIQNCFNNSPQQIERIASSIYAMTAEETVVRLESAPKINTQIGPMFTNWLRRKYSILNIHEFQRSTHGIHVLGGSEEEGKNFVIQNLGQNLLKRPDLIAKVNNLYIIGEAKWIGQSGGNQEKQVKEINYFCESQRGDVRRVGIVDGFPWSIYRTNGKIINDKVVVQIQESNYDVISALLLDEYLNSFL